MRKLLAYALIFISIFTLAGCGEEIVEEQPTIREGGGQSARPAGGKMTNYRGVNE